MTKTVLITGANKGIGLEFTKQYIKTYKVIACCRQPKIATELNNLAKSNNNLQIMTLDINNKNHIDNLKHTLNDEPIDYLINNAGIYGIKGERFINVDSSNMQNVIQTNAISTFMLCQALVNNVIRSENKTIITISSKMASIADNQYGNSYAYRASKVALNAMMRSMSIDLKKDGIKVLILHPGWVKTSMGGDDAHIDVHTSVQGMMKLINDNNFWQSGDFYDYNREKIPW